MYPTLVIGASTNPERYSFKAANSLLNHGHEVYLFGVKKGNVKGIEIQNEFPSSINIHTVTMYVNPTIQKEYYESILALKPSRVIFNPGTENPEFEKLLSDNNIAYEEACTLVLLSTGQY